MSQLQETNDCNLSDMEHVLRIVISQEEIEEIAENVTENIEEEANRKKVTDPNDDTTVTVHQKDQPHY